MIAYGTWLIQNFYVIAIGLTGVGCVIAFHELGHFLFCKLFNVHVPVFSIGFGPRILNKKIGETTFSLSLIPVGGYVEAEMGQTEGLPNNRNMENKPYWQKLCIACGGIFFNLIFAYIILTGLSMLGIPSNPFLIQEGSYSIKKISTHSPAEKAGLQQGDIFLKVNDSDVSNHIEKLFKALQPLANKEATITIKREGTEKTFNLIVGSRTVKGKEQGVIGIEEFLFPSLEPVCFTKALVQSFNIIQKLVLSTLNSLTLAFKKRSAQGFSGPLMLISLTIASIGQGAKLFFIFLTIISISLAVLNILPLPILDGGRIFTLTIEAIIGRPLPEKFIVIINYVSVVLMIGIFIFLTIKDVKDLL